MVDLVNASAGEVAIAYDASPFEQLDLITTDGTGRVVSEYWYGSCFSSNGFASACLRLTPGDRFSHTVLLLGNMPMWKVNPGRYQVRAVFEYEGFRTYSEFVAVEVSEDDCRKSLLWRYARA